MSNRESETCDTFEHPSRKEVLVCGAETFILLCLYICSILTLVLAPHRTVALTPLPRFNKTASFSQFPHESDFSCPFFRDGACYANHSFAHSFSQDPLGDATPQQMHGLDNIYHHHPTSSTTRMGYSVRTQRWRFTLWLPWTTTGETADWSPSAMAAAPLELYDESLDDVYSSTGGGDRGSDFDAMDVINQAYNSSLKDVVASHLKMVTYQFKTLAPPGPTPPSPSPGPSPGPAPSPAKAKACAAAGGVLNEAGGGGRNVACCPSKCGTCGGKGCAKRPGGKLCCAKSAKEPCAPPTVEAPCTV